jgi:hypothetical protein
MTPEKQEELFKRYPKIFSDLKWTECADGWFDLIDSLCRVIQNEWDNHSYKMNEEEKAEGQPIAVQVKEKFGGLRFYICGGDANEAIRGAIRMAESMSFTVCESCGHPGHKQPGGWIKTLCDPCQEGRATRKLT